MIPPEIAWSLSFGAIVFIGSIACFVKAWRERRSIQITDEDRELIEWLRNENPDVWGMVGDRKIARMARDLRLYDSLRGGSRV